MPRWSFAHDDEELIREYEQYHQPDYAWSEVIDSIHNSGILDMQIYRSGTQLIMVMTVSDSFSFSTNFISRKALLLVMTAETTGDWNAW